MVPFYRLRAGGAHCGDLPIESLDVPLKLFGHSRGPIGDLFSVTFDGLCPLANVVEVPLLLFDRSSSTLDLPDDGPGASIFAALPHGERASQTVRHPDNEIPSGIVRIPYDHDVHRMALEGGKSCRRVGAGEDEHSDLCLTIASRLVDLVECRSKRAAAFGLGFPDHAGVGSRAIRSQLDDVVAHLAVFDSARRVAGRLVNVTDALSLPLQNLSEPVLELEAVTGGSCFDPPS